MTTRTHIQSLGFKFPPAIARRIEWLGQMNDRLIKCIAAGDRTGLLELAAEYAQHPYMLDTAKRVAFLAKEGKR